MDILQAIGSTSMVRLRKVPPAHAEILVKLEWENPTGSMKDRMALAVISQAEGRRPSEAWRHRRRVHGRQHRGVARAGLRGEGVPSQDRDFGCLQPREAGSHGGAGGGADDRPQRGRPHHQEADPGHDGGRHRRIPAEARRRRRVIDHFASSTDRILPAGSLNHAIFGPPPWKTPLSSVLMSPSV